MKRRISVLAVATLIGVAAFTYSPAEAPAFSCSLCDSERMDESEMCSTGASVMKHTFYGTEGGRFSYNNPHSDWKCGYCIDYHSACGDASAAAIDGLERAISTRSGLQAVLAKHAKVAAYDPESGRVMVKGCGENAVNIAIPQELQGSLAD